MNDSPRVASPGRPALAIPVGAALAAALLLVAAPRPLAVVAELRDAGAAPDATDPLVALLTLLAWGLTAWLALTVLLTAGAHLPGQLGRAAGAVARRIAPAAVRRGVEVALGLTVAVGVLGASPAAAAPGPAGGPVAPAAASLDWAAAPSPDRLAASAAEAPSLDGPVSSVPDQAPSLDWPVATAPDHAPSLDWPVPIAPDQAASPPVQPRAVPTATVGGRDVVVVQPGDSLWVIAERELTARGDSPSAAEVAQAWPSWWAANRAAIGDDPDLITPGTALTPPRAEPDAR